MIETRAAAQARTLLTAHIEGQKITVAQMANQLGFRENNLQEWLDGKLSYTVELKVRKFLGQDVQKHPGFDVKEAAPAQDPVPTPNGRPTESGIETLKGDRYPVPNGHPPTPVAEPVPPTPAALEKAIELLPEKSTPAEVTPIDDFEFFTTTRISTSGWSSPGIKIAANRKRIVFNKAFRELAGTATFAKVARSTSSKAVLLVPDPAIDAERPDVVSLTAKSHEFSAGVVVDWMLENGFKPAVRYAATQTPKGILIRAEL